MATTTEGALSTYDYWLFDLDGTLTDTEWWYVRETFDRIEARTGLSFTDREARLLWHGLAGSRSALLESWGIDPEPFWPVFNDAHVPAERAEATYLYDDAELVGAIQSSVGIVTHCQSFLVEPIFDALDIGDWFDAVVCTTADLGWKPDPAPVERALAGLPAETESGRGVLVGDMPNDVGAAWNAGLDAIHVERHGHDRRGACVRADRRVGSLDELRRSDRA